MSVDDNFHFADNYYLKKMLGEQNKPVLLTYFRVLLVQFVLCAVCVYAGFYLYHTVIASEGVKYHFMAYQSGSLWGIYFLYQVFISMLIWIYVRKYIKKRMLGHWMDSFFQGIEQNPASIVLTEKNGHIQYANRKFLELSGCRPEEVYMENAGMLRSGQRFDAGYNKRRELINDGEARPVEFHDGNGELRRIFASISPIFDNKGGLLQYLGIQGDTSERRRLQTELEKQATTDYLTKLYNRRSFFNKLEVEIARSKRSGNAFSLIMIDIDYFKNINVGYGHRAGDFVLQDLANILKKNSRIEDICAWFGGEEFIMILPETLLDPAKILVDRLKDQVEAQEVCYENHTIRYTLSIGITQWDGDEDPEKTIARADANLYQAKQGGRNRIIAL